MAVSSSNGGLGLLTGDLVVTVVCGAIEVVAGKDSSGGSRIDGGEGESVTVVSGTSAFTTWVTSTSCGVSGGSGTTASGFKAPGAGSSKHSRLDFSQRGQTQFLDLESERGGIG